MKAGKIVIDDAEYSTILTDKYLASLEQKEKNKDQVCSFIPGVIQGIKVRKGERVKAGNCLVVLEAMKMYNEITVNYSIQIEEICVKKGEVVPKNHVLVKFRRV